MYRNIVYSAFNRDITLWTWDANGERIMEKYPYKPYLYVDDPTSNDAISLYGGKIRKVEFVDKKLRDRFCVSNEKVYGNLPPVQQFLIDKYHGLNKKSEFSVYPLKIYSLDIETFSENGFPDPKQANDKIVLISVHNSIDDGIYTFGLAAEYHTSNEKVIYKCFETEEELLKAFIKFWRKDFPDIVTGWYIDGFDVPYICNRINKLYGDDEACFRLSPTGRVWKQDNVKKRLQDYEQLWTIEGVTILDYQYIYKVFTKDKRESYSLNAICEEELGSGKLKYDAVSLSELCKTDWHKFVDYNIQDVNLLVELEEKLKYLKVCRELAYKGLTHFASSVSTIGIVDGLAAQQALEHGKTIPTFKKPPAEPFEGGFVRVPQTGLKKSILYYDANSLYPNTIVTLNISPETKLGKITRRDVEKDEYDILSVSGKLHTITKAHLDAYILKEQICISKSDILFSQKKRGIFSEIIEEIYAERVSIKKEMKRLHGLNLTNENDIVKNKYKIDQLDTRQYMIKILLNRIYGYFANPFAALYDIQLASSVTLTGQAGIKIAASVGTEYLNNKAGFNFESVIMGDTDSVVFTVQPILEKNGQDFYKDGAINTLVYEIADGLGKEIDTKIEEWAKTELHSTHSTYQFKRENISSRGIFLLKKRYILNIADDEGKIVDKFKYTGVAVVSTSTPKRVKPLIKKAIETIIKSGDKKAVEQIIKDTYTIYQTFTIEEQAVTKSLNNYTKYLNKAVDMKAGKGTPNHVKGAIYYNTLLKRFNLDKKVESLKNGDKLKTFWLLPNKYNIESIAFATKFPEEFKKHFAIDVKKMYNNTLLTPIKSVFESIGWEIKNPTTEEKVDLLDMFGA